MQSVRFINPKLAEVEISENPPFLFESISGIGEMAVQLITSEPANLDGTSFSGLYLPPREITVIMHVYGATRANMYENKMLLSTILSTEHYKDGALGRLEYTNDFGSWWIPAAVKSGPEGKSRAGNYLVSEPLVFYCPNPYWRGFTYNRARMAYLGGGMRFPLRLPMRFGSHAYKASLFNFGNRPSHLELSITGPAIAPEIQKISTGEYIRLREDKELSADDILYIDTTPGRISVTIQHAAGTTENAIGYIDLSSEFFLMSPGENPLTFVSADDSQTSMINMATLPWFGGV